MFYGSYLAPSSMSGEFVQVNTSRAYANIYLGRGPNAAASPGDGVTISFVDDGLDAGNPAFGATGKSVSVAGYFGNASQGSDVAGGKVSHGTYVASIAAGVRAEFRDADNPETVITTDGVAPGADVKMFAFSPGDGDSILRDTIVATLNDPDTDIVNVSVEPKEPYIATNPPSFNPVDFLSRDYEQSGTPDSAKKVVVWGAGNKHDHHSCGEAKDLSYCEGGRINANAPSIFAALPVHVPELRPFWVAVVAVNSSGTIADYSNRCGIAAEWCIAAPGDLILAPQSKGDSGLPVRGTATVNGTSFAAPIVAGGLALMKQRFPEMSNIELLQRMYATANKEGIYADTATYGQGLLDLGAAMAPIGGTTAVTASAEDAVLNDGVLRRASPVSASPSERRESKRAHPVPPVPLSGEVQPAGLSEGGGIESRRPGYDRHAPPALSFLTSYSTKF